MKNQNDEMSHQIKKSSINHNQIKYFNKVESFNNKETQQFLPTTTTLTAKDAFNNSKHLKIIYAVNGCSKQMTGTSTVPQNINLNNDDYGDDCGIVVENTKSIVIGKNRRMINFNNIKLV
jgi:hypothetical protein